MKRRLFSSVIFITMALQYTSCILAGEDEFRNNFIAVLKGADNELQCKQTLDKYFQEKPHFFCFQHYYPETSWGDRTEYFSKKYLSPFCEAVEVNKLAVVKWFLEKKNIELLRHPIIYMIQTEIYNNLSERKLKSCTIKRQDKTSLYRAIELGYKEIAIAIIDQEPSLSKWMLDCSSDGVAGSGCGYFESETKFTGLGYIPPRESLKDDQRVRVSSERFESVLHCAIKKQDVAIVAKLIDKGGLSLLKTRSSEGKTPLTLAKENQYTEIVKQIEAKEAELFKEYYKKEVLPAILSSEKTSLVREKKQLEQSPAPSSDVSHNSSNSSISTTRGESSSSIGESKDTKQPSSSSSSSGSASSSSTPAKNLTSITLGSGKQAPAGRQYLLSVMLGMAVPYGLSSSLVSNYVKNFGGGLLMRYSNQITPRTALAVGGITASVFGFGGYFGQYNFGKLAGAGLGAATLMQSWLTFKKS